MKLFILKLSLLLIGSSAFSQTRFGHIHSKGSDCGVIDVEDAYLVSSSGQKHLEIKASIQDLAYNKRVYLAHANGPGAEVLWNKNWWDYSATMRMDYREGNRDHVVIYDQMVGVRDDYKVSLYITMYDHEYSCSAIVIGK